jgi:hypothetical protein
MMLVDMSFSTSAIMPKTTQCTLEELERVWIELYCYTDAYGLREVTLIFTKKEESETGQQVEETTSGGRDAVISVDGMLRAACDLLALRMIHAKTERVLPELPVPQPYRFGVPRLVVCDEADTRDWAETKESEELPTLSQAGEELLNTWNNFRHEVNDANAVVYTGDSFTLVNAQKRKR